jgi:hypothetical protein
MLEVLQCLLHLVHPLKFVLSLQELNLFKAAMHPMSFWTSLTVARAPKSVMALIFSGLASISRRLMMKPSSLLQPKGYGHISIRNIRGYESSLDLVFFLGGNLMVA